MSYLIISIFIIALIIIAVYLSYSLDSSYLIKGFWLGDPDFCEKADLELIMMYFGERSGNIIPGYIIMKNSEGLILNNPFDLSISKNLGIDKEEIYYSLHFDWLDEEEFSFFPSDQELCYYPVYGKLVLYKEDQINAILFKDNKLTDISSKKIIIPENLKKTDLSDL